MLSDKQILSFIERQPKGSAGYKQLVREMGIRGNERRELEIRLKHMTNRGDLKAIGRDRWAVPSSDDGKNLISGRLTMHRDGYGFVIPESASVREKIDGDIFIPPPAIGQAMHGDHVLVEISGVPRDGRAEGRIVKVADRAHTTIVGTFHYGTKYNYVTPIDEKITGEVIIPPGMEIPKSRPNVPGKSTPHRVIGSEAHLKQWDDLEDVVVDVLITQWPTATQNAHGRIVEILGYEDDFGVDVEIIIRKHHLPHIFPTEVLEQAQGIDSTIPSTEVRDRRDYRDLPIITIDGETARDFDDAVLARILPNGNYELQVHIADVAQYVGEDTPVDNDARLRGTSVYFPDRAVPMLPLELSTDICSLRPNLDRLVLSCIMEIDHAGEVVGYEIHEGIIRSAARMTYNNVQLILDSDEAARREYSNLVEHIELARKLAELLNRKRERRGSIDFDLPEPLIEFDENGLMKGITRSERKFSHRLIEEFMLAANESVASYFESHQIAALYRIHEKPSPKKIYDFELLAASFGYTLGMGSLPIKKVQVHGDRRHHQGSGRNAPPVELPEDIHITPRMYQKLTKKIAGTPEERILSFLMLRSLKQAKYSENNEGHFALAASTYTHFTSPIRRYPDLIVHRILKEVIREKEADEPAGAPPVNLMGNGSDGESLSPWSKHQPVADRHAGRRRSKHQRQIADQHEGELSGPIPEHILHDIAEESSQSERRADEAERELTEWKKIKFMRDRVGEEFDALIISVAKYGFFVELTDMFVEGLVPINTLADDHYTFRENTRQIMGERTKKIYAIGDRVRVILDRIDREQRKLQFSVEAPLSDSRKAKPSSPLPKQSKKKEIQKQAKQERKTKIKKKNKDHKRKRRSL
ncbi:MAG: ribonuclease [Acidobacteriales bacterium]|nr:ribonuclease [Terriglobales bacterium]